MRGSRLGLWRFRGKPCHVTRSFSETMHLCVAEVPFWRSKLQGFGGAVDSDGFNITQIPLTFRHELRGISPYELLPSRAQTYHMCRGTGGTTGPPLFVFWTLADWTAAIQAISRWMDPLIKLSPLIAWNGYNQGHVAGPSFDDLIRSLGGTPVARHIRSRDADALDDIRRMRVNVLVITPQSGSGKGAASKTCWPRTTVCCHA